VFYGDLQAVHDATLRLERGEMVSLIGANGAGKSTLLSAIVGIIKPQGGHIFWKGEDITGLQTNEIVSRGISLAPEGSHVFEEMTIQENLLLASQIPKAKNRRKQNFEKVYATFPVLKEKEKQLACFLSGGQRQMLAIARAIMAEPELIICDELSLGLAPVVIKEIYASLRQVNAEGVTFLLVEQEVKRCLEYTDYAYVLVKGRIVMQGKCDELPEDEVNDAYFGMNKYA
jgi:branched-chain amino acid transport system ATP-binding protein